VGSALSGVAEAPSIVADDVDEDRLVVAVRRGDDRAFEALYSRYQRRIHAYVVGMVKDHGRAEDITQEVFVSALRRMRATERPIAFKPWIYEIAKNACIDQYRRSRRTEEVSIEADEGLAPADYGKLVNSGPTPEAAVAAKQDLDTLCGALGGLSDAHHEILVLREFEGLSYQEIGERMNMSRPAVESTLFRARRRLTEEFEELVTGARCVRIQDLITTASENQLGTREARRLSRHISHCQPCRREAMAAGLDTAILTHVPLRRRAAAKVAGLLPFPIFTRSRGGGGAADAPGSSLANLPLFSEQLAGAWGKLATAAVVLVAGAGAAGVGTKVVSAGPDTDTQSRPALERRGGAERKASAPADTATRAVAAERKRNTRGDRTTTADRRERTSSKGGAAPSSSGGSDGAANIVPAVTGGGGGGGALGGGALGGITPPAGTGAPNVVPPAPKEVELPITPPAAPKVTPPEVTAPAVGGGGTAGTLPAAVQEKVDDTTGAVEGATGIDLP
jgi:RNA polymerase sigma factor (sigma-70 family)